MKNKKIGKILAVTSLVGVLAVGGAMAYFTDGDSAVNTFTVGKVSIDLKEDVWDSVQSDYNQVLPNQILTKDPTIHNDGTNDAYVFLEITIPQKEVTKAGADGTKGSKEKQDIATFTKGTGWEIINTEEDVPIGEGGETGTKYRLVYGTSSECTRLTKGSNTGSAILDNKLQIINFVEDEGMEETQIDIPVTAYAIQADFIGAEGEYKTAPADVWSVIEKQNPDTTEK